MRSLLALFAVTASLAVVPATPVNAAGGGDWVALDSRLDGGRTLRYRRSPGELGAPSVIQAARADGPGPGR